MRVELLEIEISVESIRSINQLSIFTLFIDFSILPRSNDICRGGNRSFYATVLIFF